MKILWIVNTIFPYPSEKLCLSKSNFGGWMLSLHNELININQDISLAIVTTYNGEFRKFDDEKTIYYMLNCKHKDKYDKKLEKSWQSVIEDFKPDIIHIHGSEYAHALPLIKILADKIPTVLSIQGLISVYSKDYLANICEGEIRKNITLRDILKNDNIIQAQKKFKKRGLLEQDFLRKINNIIGRTSWDLANTKAINPTICYYKNNESLRESFYNNKWDIEKIQRDTIFFSQAAYPIKGLHLMLEALSIIKKERPNIKLRIAGNNILLRVTLTERLKLSGYAKYINSLIIKYNLIKNIEFTGQLNEQQMCQEYLKCNVFVQASSVENSPNSLGEAMILGVPCVASNVGGTSDMLEDKFEGFLYPYTETAMLAYYVLQILNNDSLAEKLGKNARKKAMITHDRKINTDKLIKIYSEIIKGKAKYYENN